MKNVDGEVPGVMERAQIVVVAAVVAALALFGLRIWADKEAEEVSAAGRVERARDLASIERDGGERGDREWGGEGEKNRIAAAKGRGGLQGGESGQRSGFGSGGGADGGSAVRAGGAAEALRGGVTRRGGDVGTSGSAPHARGESGVFTSAGEVAPGVSRLLPRAEQRTDLIDFLAAREPTGSEFGGPENMLDDPEGDVALEVLNTEDAAQATAAENIEEPDDRDDGIKFTAGSEMKFPNAGNANGQAGAITFDIEPEWMGSDDSNNSLVQIRNEHQWNNRMELVKNGHFLRFILADNTGREADISVRIDDWVEGETHSITATWGEARTSLFIDGRLAGSNTYSGDFDIAPGTPMFLGSDYRSSAYDGANSTISGFTLYSSSRHP